MCMLTKINILCEWNLRYKDADSVQLGLFSFFNDWIQFNVVHRHTYLSTWIIKMKQEKEREVFHLFFKNQQKRQQQNSLILIFWINI